MNKKIKGYKVFNPKWMCNHFQYEVGKIFKNELPPIYGKQGFHFCKKAADCFNYYPFSMDNKLAEVIALGKTDTDGTNYCTNQIMILREISWLELLTILKENNNCTETNNTGDYNSGSYNTGDYNSGNYNTGNYNTGNYNAGDSNTGNYNLGHFNTGDSNTGHGNIGCHNTGCGNCGNWNTGNENTGDWNKASFSNGCFMTKQTTLHFFNQPSSLTYSDWDAHPARELLNKMPRTTTEWISKEEMTEKKKRKHPSFAVTTGYLKTTSKKKNKNLRQVWWDHLPKEEQELIKSIPNFDAEIFKECTGINPNHKTDK